MLQLIHGTQPGVKIQQFNTKLEQHENPLSPTNQSFQQHTTGSMTDFP